MESQIHSLNSLFDQLGLDASDEAIDHFIALHTPVPPHLRLHEADFWNASQAAFLKEVIDEDADWAELVDQLDAMLR